MPCGTIQEILELIGEFVGGIFGYQLMVLKTDAHSGSVGARRLGNPSGTIAL